MRRALFGVCLFAWLAVGAACTEPRSERCKYACEREAKCSEDTDSKDFRFDAQECVSACAALERDAEGERYVKRHADCVAAAKSCNEVYACNFPYQESR
jgi:hypothetical protein